MIDTIFEDDIWKPLIEIFDAIAAEDDNNINELSVQNFIMSANAALDRTVRNEIITAYANQLKLYDASRETALQGSSIILSQFSELIDTYNPSDLKREAMNGIANIIVDVLDEGVAVYINSLGTEVKIVLCREGAKAPIYANKYASGADIFAPEEVVIPKKAIGVIVPTGLKAQIPEGWELQVRSRSGMAAKTGLRISNGVGTIDADYRGEIGVIFDNLSNEDYTIKAGDRIAQLVLAPRKEANYTVVSELESTERGEGGFGSTGE